MRKINPLICLISASILLGACSQQQVVGGVVQVAKLPGKAAKAAAGTAGGVVGGTVGGLVAGNVGRKYGKMAGQVAAEKAIP